MMKKINKFMFWVGLVSFSAALTCSVIAGLGYSFFHLGF